MTHNIVIIVERRYPVIQIFIMAMPSLVDVRQLEMSEIQQSKVNVIIKLTRLKVKVMGFGAASRILH